MKKRKRKMDRNRALALVEKYLERDNMIKHSLAVESAMRAYARKLDGDEQKWGIAGLLHDIDYDVIDTDGEHAEKGAEILKEAGYPEDIIYSVKAHADHTNLNRRRPMDKALYAVDELTGFLVAVALVMPNQTLEEVKISSVKKKLDSSAFAKSVSRKAIKEGAEQLGVTLEEHIETVLNAMRDIAGDLGLD